MDTFSDPWPWYVAGPLIGLFVPALLLIGHRRFGVSSSLRHICAATVPGRADHFRYDWKRNGLWNLMLVLGLVIGGVIATTLIGHPPYMGVSDATISDLSRLGLDSFEGFLPSEIFSWSAMGTLAGLVSMVLGGLFIGFGARWADGCTSGHAITGIAELQPSSLAATASFFVGGLIVTWFILPMLLSVSP